MKILCLGDSLTYGYPFSPKQSWVGQLAATFSKDIFHNGGLNGDTLQGMTYRWEETFSQETWDMIIVLGGANDVNMGSDAAYCFRTYRRLGELLLAKNIPLIVGLTMPFPYDDEKTKVICEYNENLRQWAREQKLPLIDFYRPMEKALKKGEFVFDGDVHPSLRGYALMFEVALPIVQKSMRRIMEERERHTWNLRAQDFYEAHQRRERRKQVDSFIAFIKEKGLVNEGDTILDVGCGTGDYLLGLESLKEKTGELYHCIAMDVSDEMIRLGKSQSKGRIHWIRSPWNEEIFEKEKLAGAVDFAYSMFCPAMTQEGLYYLDRAARKANLVVTFINREESAYDRIAQALMPPFGKKEEHKKEKGYGIKKLLAYLEAMGRHPEVFYEENAYDEVLSYEEALRYFTKRLYRHLPMELERLEEKVRDHMLRIYGEKVKVEGIANHTKRSVGWIYWKK